MISNEIDKKKRTMMTQKHEFKSKFTTLQTKIERHKRAIQQQVTLVRVTRLTLDCI